MGFSLSGKNLLALATAPFTAGASLALLEDKNGNNAIDYITGAKTAKEANKQNIELQKETNATSIELANSAHQREIADLKAAGLNPILSAGGSGATTPTLGTAQVQNTMPGGYLSQAGQAVNLVTGLAQAQQSTAQAELNKAQAINTQTDTQYMPAMKKAEIAAQYANAGNAKAQADYTNVMKDVDKELKSAETAKNKAETTKIDKETPYGGKTAGTISKYTGTAKDVLRLLPGGKYLF